MNSTQLNYTILYTIVWTGPRGVGVSQPGLSCLKHMTIKFIDVIQFYNNIYFTNHDNTVIFDMFEQLDMFEVKSNIYRSTKN